MATDRLSFAGKVAIITGSSSGIGEATAVLFAKRKCTVVICGRDEKRLAEVKQQCLDIGASPEKLMVFAGDLRIDKERKKLVNLTVNAFGRLDILVNSAAETGFGHFTALTEDDFDRIGDCVFKMQFFLTQNALPHLIVTKGNVVNISSVSSVIPNVRSILYTSFKSALDMMARSLAVEYGYMGLRFNSINPGGYKTPAMDKTLDKMNVPMEKRQEIFDMERKRHALNRLSKPHEVPEMIAFIASDAASFITAQTIFVDGGMSQNYYPSARRP